MTSTISACLATPFEITGVNYSISSACSTTRATASATRPKQIQLGKQDVVFAGGGEEAALDADDAVRRHGRAVDASYNDTPEKASRPYDTARDGFVIAGGAGIVVLEELEHAQARGAPIIAELVGYGATSDGYDMVAPSGEGAVRCMRQALAHVEGRRSTTSTPTAPSRRRATSAELDAIAEVFGDDMPPVSSTKSLTGHSLGAAGVQEAIYSLYMLARRLHRRHRPTSTTSTRAPRAARSCTSPSTNVTLDTVMSNSFGFGGTNATLAFRRYWPGARPS
ncbi:MAG: beta-ketoacyl synthase N-terminal-like domain-containing protein [Halofilum sp. (in: g-proteobacteria)]|nr:beta-ketoacyl synthase N-terminal-like domain-containing protein [Halofilum sp. (in: g-proteobacteria)]